MQQSRLSLIPAHPRRRNYIQHHNMVALASEAQSPSKCLCDEIGVDISGQESKTWSGI